MHKIKPGGRIFRAFKNTHTHKEFVYEDQDFKKCKKKSLFRF